ncbi:MAG: hypothetical protein R3F21_18695 [Myxococcota bacterium]
MPSATQDITPGTTIVIDCPDTDWNGPFPGGVIDVTLSGGCYDRVRQHATVPAGSARCPVPEAEPICDAGCDAGLVSNPVTTLCGFGSPGSPCGPGVPCAEKGSPVILSRASSASRPRASALRPQSLPEMRRRPAVHLALVCSHDPARENEPCDILHGALRQRPLLQARHPQGSAPPIASPGKAAPSSIPASPGRPARPASRAMPFAVPVFLELRTTARSPSSNAALYSGGLPVRQNEGLTMTYASGDGVSIVASESQAFGFAYGQNGEYGCFTSFCYGIDIDVSIGGFISVGQNDDFDGVDELSWNSVQELGVPGDILSFSFTQSYPRVGLLPVAMRRPATRRRCRSVSAPILAVLGRRLPLHHRARPDLRPGRRRLRTPAAASAAGRGQRDRRCPVRYGARRLDLRGNGGVCSWVEDDPMASTISGSGEVLSPPGFGGRIVSNCVSVTPGEQYEIDAWIKDALRLRREPLCQWTASSNCIGLVSNQFLLNPPADNVWYEYRDILTAPPGAFGRVKATSAGDAGTGVSGATQIDGVYLPEPGLGTGLLGGALSLLLAESVRRAARKG